MRGKDARTCRHASLSSGNLSAHWCAASTWRVAAWPSGLWQDPSSERNSWGKRAHWFVWKLTDCVQELRVPFISISAPSIVSGMSGESEKTLRDTFDEAKVHIIFRMFFSVLIITPSVLLRVYCSSTRSMLSLQNERAPRGRWNDA
jgi:hypothetical protein